MSIEKIKEAISEIDASSKERLYLSEKNAVSETQINDAEKIIGYSFPPSYRYFLSTLGSGDFRGIEFYGLIPNKNNYPSVPNALWLTEEAIKNEELPSDLFVIESLDDGCNACIELSKKPSEERQIILWDIGEAPTKSRYVLGNNFGDYFYNKIMGALNE